MNRYSDSKSIPVINTLTKYLGGDHEKESSFDKNRMYIKSSWFADSLRSGHNTNCRSC
jgi:hypothetical protein